MKQTIVLVLGFALASVALAKLPPPSEEAAAKAAEAAAKSAWSGKVANFQLCKSMDKTAAYYYKSAKSTGKPTQPPLDTPACADPGAFVYKPAPAAPPAAAAAAPAAAPAPAAAASPAKS